MSQSSRVLSRFWSELKRRKVFRSLAIYAGTAFVVLEASTIIFPRWGFPDWTIDLVLWLLILGALVNVIIAWFYDLTAGGMQRTVPRERVPERQEAKDSRGWKVATYISLVVIVALILWNAVGGVIELRAGDIRSLVILPFDNFTGDDHLEYFVSGMHASLVNDMGQISGLRVISKTSANAYKNSRMTAGQIARELHVDGVVEASVLCLGDSLCMQFRLIDAKGDEKQLWSSDYREDKSQILNLYNRITRQIADEVKIELMPDEVSRLAVSRTVDPDAYDAYLKAQYSWERLTPEGLDSAYYYFQRAMDLEPEWADPYSGMAMTLAVMGSFISNTQDANLSEAFRYLDRALELDPDAAYTHYARGLYAVWPGGRWKEGEREFQRCLELNPSDALCRIYYAHLLMILHRFEEAEQQARRALELDPLRPLVLGLYGVVMNYLGHYRETLVQAEKAMSIDPDNGFAPGPLAKACLATGDTLRWYELWKQHLWWSTPAYLDSLDRVFREEGYLAVIRDRIRVNEEVHASGGFISCSGQADRYLISGEYDRAMDYYQMGMEEGDGLISYISLDYLAFPELRDHARYLALLKEMKLPLPED